MSKPLTPKQKEYRVKLRTAIKLVQATHWIKGQYKRKKGTKIEKFNPSTGYGTKVVEKDQYCLIGVVREVDGGQKKRSLENYVRKVFVDVNPGNDSHVDKDYVEGWNDRHATTREQVVALLQAAHDQVPDRIK